MVFSLKYENLWPENFGFNYYGCCEHLHHKIEIFDKVPNLRNISMSPWANLEIAKQKTKGRCVLSCKTDHSTLLKDNYSPKAVENQITKIVDFSLKEYQAVFNYKDIALGYKNSTIYAVVGTSLNVILTIMAAYPLSRKEFKAGSFYMKIFFITMFFNGGLIPTYLIMNKL